MSDMADNYRALTYSEMRDQNLFTDAVIKTSSGRKWPVHKVVISGVGRFFSTAFTFPSFNGTLVFPVSDEVFQVIIDLAYGGWCQVNVQNVMEVSSVAFMYQMEALKKVCVTFMLNNMISLQHVLDLKVFLRVHHVEFENCVDRAWSAAWFQTIDRFIRRNFMDLYEKEEMYMTSIEDLVDFVKADDLNIEEEDLLNFVLSYVEQHELNEEQAKQLLNNVRIVLIDPAILAQISEESETLQSYMENRVEENPIHLPRYPRDIVLLVDPYDKEIFNPRKNEWKPVQMNGINPDLILGNLLYEIDIRQDGSSIIKSFDIKNGHFLWEKRSQIPNHDHDFDDLYFLAWNDGILAFMSDEHFRSAAFYYPKGNEWIPFPVRADSVSVVVNGHLFAIGGGDSGDGDEENGFTKNIEYFDMITMSWVLCGYLKENPTTLRIKAVRDKVYVFSLDVEYGEFFQPVWEDGRIHLIHFPNIQLPWRNINVEIAALDNKILFAGGILFGEEDMGRKQCHIFSPKTGQWSRAPDLHKSKLFHRAITINTSELEVARIQQICDGQLVVSDNP